MLTMYQAHIGNSALNKTQNDACILASTSIYGIHKGWNKKTWGIRGWKQSQRNLGLDDFNRHFSKSYRV